MIFRSVLIVLVLLIQIGAAHTQEIDCRHCHESIRMDDTQSLRKATSAEEKAVGVLDKGQLTNYTGNYGIISHYLEYLNDAMHWPATANEETHYSFGLGLVVASRGNVATSVLGAFAEKIDWVPKDGSRGRVYSGEVTAPPPDLTPFLPYSDNQDTWPEGYYDPSGIWIDTPGERYWPGHFRVDIDPDSPTFGEEIEGEFVSDRDVYCVFDDSDNSNPDGPMGVEVEQTAYSYGRPYAEDLLFFDYTIHNRSGQPLDSVYVGYYAVFRPDFDFMDNINIVDGSPDDPHSNGDFVYVWDINNTKDGAWENDPSDLGIIGLKILDTPMDMGVTDFHYFNREVAPKVDERMWPVISSNPSDPNLDIPSAFFHGDDRRMDDTHPDTLKKIFPDGAPLNFYIMTGPFTLESGESVKSSMAIVMGNAGPVPFAPDTTDLMNNMRMAQQMYEREYQGSGPPNTPVVHAIGGDRQVRLVWDDAAEQSVDVLTGVKDFEGYKIYRSTDKGKTWGTPVTDYQGNVAGYRPIAIYDLIDGIQGPDPAFNQSLGVESGIQHTFVDSNLINGVEYWYCVTAYDKGNQNPDSLEQSYQSALGKATLESHTVSATPGVRPQNYDPPEYSPLPDTRGSLPPIGGVCQGVVKVDIVQPDSVTGDDYLITFTDSLMEVNDSDTNYVIGFNLDRISRDTGNSTRLLSDQSMSDLSGDNLPVIDGFRLTVVNTPSGIEFIGWTNVLGDTCTFDWYTEKRTDNFQEVEEELFGYEDYRIVVVDTSEGSTVLLTDGVFGHAEFGNINIPIKVYVVTDPENPRDVSQYTEVFDLRVQFPTSSFLGPLGWDLVPGGAGYNPTALASVWPDILALNADQDGESAHIWLKTQNGPEDATPPSVGDAFTIRTYKPFREEISYRFSTQAASYPQDDRIDLDVIRVVPDPYIVSNAWETNQFGKRLMFNHLPNKCEIKIYTVAGDHVATIDHHDTRGYAFWDMRTVNDQFLAFGLYVYVVTVPSGQSKVGKFLVIK